MECELNIEKNTLDSKKMICSKGVQKLAYSIDSMGNIWTRNGQLLKRANKRSIESRIRERRTMNSQVLGNNHRGMNRFAVEQLSTSKNISSIFQLTNKSTIKTTRSFKAKKVTERAQILGSKLRVKLASKAVKKRWVVASNNDVINIKKQINKTRQLMKNKRRGVSAAVRKTKGKKKGAETLNQARGA